MTVAISLLIHGEAVRFNRGQSQGDGYNFKHLIGRDGKEYPYVSSQCYKRYWRESLQDARSPITRGKTSAGKEKNQAYTAGDPITYVDDDLFGYMIAGAPESEDGLGDDAGLPDLESKYLFEKDDIKEFEALREKLLQDNLISKFVMKSSEVFDVLRSTSSSAQAVQDAIIKALNEAVGSANLPTQAMLDEVNLKGKNWKKFQQAKTEDEKREANKEFLKKAFRKELEVERKRLTTKRTAPVRMHALVAFSGIKTAKDFQTFSRDVAYTGGNSVVNPTPPGIYSAWMKTRILIESHRIGRFYIGENMEILPEVKTQDIKTEKNPYSLVPDTLSFIELDESERKRRLSMALEALANIGNDQGPASGALHDGSLRPKAFVAGLMSCVDSPFDDIWKGNTSEGTPFLDVATLVDVVKDWTDLFATKKLYFGLPYDSRIGIEETIKTELKQLGFEAAIDSPRKALLMLAKESVL